MSAAVLIGTLALTIGAGPPNPSCTCALPSPQANLPLPAGLAPYPRAARRLTAWKDREYIFVGRALEVDPAADGSTRRVRFVVEANWRRSVADTVTLETRGSPCAYYVAGALYLVTGFAPRSAPLLVTGYCDAGYSISWPATKAMLAELGPPSWRAPAIGSRTIDEGVVPLDQAPRPDSVTVWVGLGLDPEREPDQVRIADLSVAGRSNIGFRLTPGLYVLRVEWRDGGVSETYLSVRCDEQPPNIGCYAFRYLPELGMNLEEVWNR